MAETSEILVHPEAWAEASDASRDAYERRAKDLGIHLSADRETGSEGKEVVVLVCRGDFVSDAFELAARCPRGRAAWEHIVRRELGLDDPCL